MSLQKYQIGYLEGAISAVVNVVLFGLKIWVGTNAGSVSIVADAWHTLSDTFTSLIVVFGFWISRRPRDSAHPFGHGRAEVIAAIVIGTLLAVVGFTFIMDSIGQLRDRAGAVFSNSTIAVFAISVVVKEGVAQFSLRAGRRIGSKSLAADGWHHRSDAVASAVILIGAIFGRRLWWIDGILGIGVSALIIWVAYQVIRDATQPLMGESPDEDTISRIRQLVVSSAPAVSNVHHVHLHRYGDHTEIIFHLSLPGDRPLSWAHEIADVVEERIRDEMRMEATVHVDPAD